MQVTEGHIFSQMSFRDVEDTDERLILELDTGPELVNRRGALQGGLVATLIDIAAGRLADRHVATGHDVTTADMTVHYLAPIIEWARPRRRDRRPCGKTPVDHRCRRHRRRP